MKLTDEQVKLIKGELAKGLTQKQVAGKYGVSRSTISDIATHRIHKDVQMLSPLQLSHTLKGDSDPELTKLYAENEHLREERNEYKRKLKAASRTQGLFQAVSDELQKVISPFKALPKKVHDFGLDEDLNVEHLVMHLSDGHHDEIIVPEDCGGLENYNFDISCARAERFVDATLKWTQNTLKPKFQFPSLTVLAYGDHTSGEIHGAVSRSQFKNQFNNSLAIGQLHARMYRDLAPYFERVNIVYVPGNHGRRGFKKDHHGAHDNWDYLIAKTAQLYCKDMHNVEFTIPNAFSINLDIEGIGFHIFHGDDVRSQLGIPWYGLERRRYRIMALNSVLPGTPIRYYCCGHFHKPGSVADTGGEILMNGAWKATDAYIYNTFSGYSTPMQLIHGVNKKYGVTWRLPITLKSDKEVPKRYRIEV